MSEYGTLVVRVDAATKEELAERAAEHDRSLSGEVRQALRQYLARPVETEEDDDGR